MRFNEKVVLITGAAQGIGEKTAELLANEGAILALLDRNEQRLQQTAEKLTRLTGNSISMHAVDILDATQIQHATEAIVAQHGRIDILVNCAGILQDNLLVNMTESEWDRVIDINLKGSYLLAQAVAAPMIEQGSGKMVFISSQAALGAKGRVNYAASKAGVQGITRSLAIELGPLGIHVNAVAPGFIDTEMSEVSAAFASKRGIEDFSAAKATMVEQNPLRRTGKPEDIAYAILFLASYESDYITGQTIYVTGMP